MGKHLKHALGGSLLVFFLVAQTVLADHPTKINTHPVTTNSNPVSLIPGRGTYAVISASGRYVAFESPASDLLPGTINDSWDVYLHDDLTGQIERASTRSGGEAVYNPGAYTTPPALSADGRYVTFTSEAENLVNNDGNSMPDVFLHDRVANTTEIISVAQTGKSGNDASYTPAISADGRFVVFQSYASNLVQGDTNNSLDVFIRDRQSGVTELVSIANNGAQGSDWHDYGFPGVSVTDDGRYVAFAYQILPVAGSSTTGSNIYLRDRQARTTRWIADGSLPTLTGDGRSLAFETSSALTSDDQNGGSDVYLLDLSANHFERVSVAGGVAESADALIVDQPTLSSDAHFVAFETTAALVSTDTNGVADIYQRDRQTDTTTLVSAGLAGEPGNDESHFASISADGSVIAFTSLASNLVPDDTNDQNDVFVYHRILPISAADPKIFLPVVSMN
jgi:Tol biopolymer transport system component